MAEPDRAEGSSAQLRVAAQRLYEILDRLPTFEPCRGQVENWPIEIRRRRLPVWDLWPKSWHHNPPEDVKNTWFAYGEGHLVMLEPNRMGVVGAAAPGVYSGKKESNEALARVLASPAKNIPEPTRQALIDGWRIIARKGSGAMPEVVICNEWHERRLVVDGVLPRIKLQLGDAIRAVQRLQGDVSMLEALTTDDVLHYETIDNAIAQLSPVVAEARDGIGSPVQPDAGGATALMTGQKAAGIIGVSESTLSRWRSDVPAWATDNIPLFDHLIERESGCYHRHNIMKLRKWFLAGQAEGGQTPVPCP